MSRARAGMVGATVVYAASGGALAYATFGPAGLHGGWTFAGFLLTLVPLGLGWLIAARAPASPVASALTWLAALMLATPAVEDWGQTSATDAAWWGSGFVAVAGAGVWPWQVVGFMALLLVFPDGLLPGLRWRVIAALVPLSAVGVMTAFVVTMNHDDEPSAHSPVSVPEAAWLPVMLGALACFLAVVVACAASAAVRYLRADDRTRAQLRWLLFAAALVVALMVASWVVVSLGWTGPAAYSGFLFGIVVLVPAAVAVAVLRHDLFEIDRVLSDSAAWVLTTAITAGVFAVSAALLGWAFGRDSAIGLSGSVFLAAVLLLPVYRRVHDATGRVFDRDRTVILARIGDFVDRVRDGAAEPESVQDALRAAVGDPALVLLLTDAERGGHVDLSGQPAVAPAGSVVVPLRTADADIGVVVVGPRSARQLRRIRLAAWAARLPIEVSRLRLGLRRAIGEVSDSRRRLVSAAIAERTRLERDLHDGAQQQLVAIGMQLRAAQRGLAPDDPVVAELDQAVERLERTVGELRGLAHGLRPASLDDGLAAAMRQLGADCGIPVDYDMQDVTASDVIASTAYFVVAEALTNVLKHAKASRIQVQMRHGDGRLVIRVVDDGVGGVPHDHGLTTLRDRVAAVGGALSVASTPRTGTTVEAVMPCAS